MIELAKTQRLSICSLVMAGFLVGGVPMPMMLFAAIILLGFFFHRGLSDNIGSLGWPCLFLVMLLLPILWTPLSSYSLAKTQKLLLYLPIVALAPILLYQKHKNIDRLILGLFLVSLLSCLVGLYALASSGGGLNRLSIFGRGTIGLGRAVGMGFLISFIWLMDKKLSLLVGAGLCLAFLAVLFGTGQRGPLVATGLTGLLIFAFLYPKNKRAWGLFGLLIALGTSLMTYLWTQLPPGSITRITKIFVNISLDQSSNERKMAWTNSLIESATAPFGYGWGQFTSVVSVGSSGMSYPHNLLIEVLLEAGWIPAICLIVMSLISFFRFARFSFQSSTKVCIALLSYSLLAALVAGDATDARIYYFFLLLGLTPLFQKANDT